MSYRVNNLILWTFSALIAVALVSPAFAEVGKDYDRELLGVSNGLETWKWTSHYERIGDGSKWVNYLSNENATHFVFESANISVVFDKQTCDFKLFEQGHIRFENQTKATYEKDILVNSVVQSPVCEFSKLPQANGFKITTKQKGSGYEVRTIYDLTAAGTMEWTYEPDNFDIFASKDFAIIEKCADCEIKSVDGDRIDIGSYELDTKNRVHNSLTTTSMKDGLSLTYESNNVSVFDSPKIDPVFSSNNPTNDGYIRSTFAGGAACATGVTERDTTNVQLIHFIQDSADVADGCYFPFSQWDISSLPSNIFVVSTIFKFDVLSVTSPRNCSFIDMGSVTLASSDADLYTALRTNTAYLTGNTQCTTAADNKSVTLGTVANTDITTQVTTSDVFLLGWRFDDISRDGSDHATRVESEDSAGSPTPKPTLEVTYTTPITYTAAPTLSVVTVGDTARITPTQAVAANGMNLTSVSLLVNGTTVSTNSTGKTFTSWPNSFTWTPFWYRMTTDGIYDFEIQVTTDPQPNMQLSNTVSYFTFEETDAGGGLADHGLEGNHASMGAGSYATTAGQIGNLALSLDNLSYVTVPNESDYDFERTDDFSISFWVKTSQSVFDALVSKMSAAFTDGYRIAVRSTGEITVSLRNTATTNEIEVRSTSTINNGAFHHVVITYDGSSSASGVKIYIDGELETSSIILNTLSASMLNNVAVTLGSTSGASNLTGDMDDVRIFSREISANEVKQLYNLGSDVVTNFDTESRQFAPTYIAAETPSQGTVNYTRSDATLTVNRIIASPANLTETWQLELCYRDFATVFLGNDDCQWFNSTNIGYASQASPNPGFDYYVTAYNEDLLFSDLLVPASSNNLIVAGFVIFDQLGGFLGAPSVLLFVLAIFSWGTGRNFPIVLVIGISAIALMGALGLLIMEDELWGLIFVLGGIGLLGIRKFF